MPILILLMFLLGIDINKKAFTDIAHNPKAVLLGLVGQLIVLPVIAFSVAWFLEFPPIYFMGLVLVACCPGGSSSNVFSMLAKGDVALSVTLTALSIIITLFTLPIIMEFITAAVSDMSGVSIELPVGKLLVQNIVLLFFPLFTGNIFKHFCPEAAVKVSKVLGKMVFPALMIRCSILPAVQERDSREFCFIGTLCSNAYHDCNGLQLMHIQNRKIQRCDKAYNSD